MSLSTDSVNTQLATLRSKIGESSDASQGRWTTSQLLAQLNESRRVVAEETRCYQIRDSQTVTLPAAGSRMLISVPNELIWVSLLEYAGRPLRFVRPDYWRDVVGTDDTLTGDPKVATFFGRQFQLFRVPVVASTLRYFGWAYPDALVSGGIDSAFTQKAAETAIWHAAMSLKGSDDRSYEFEERMYARGEGALKKQYMPKGPRYVNTAELAGPDVPNQ